ncbi:ketopantoate reductase family protein [Streptomyces sp. NPDC057367]|uniref:ketopantoate reductase family protein n=1 Tax=Streptomyces sp. NPDC057367 TaxID=3346108 RepID=UPI00362F7B1D
MPTSPVRPDAPAPAPPWTVAVLGPGGVGGLLAALLARAGHRVICLAGPATAAVLREDGLRVRSAQFGDFSVPVEAAAELREPVDLCLVTVKNTQLEEALGRVPRGLLGQGLVLPLLNGVEHLAALTRHFGEGRVVPGVIRVESTRVAPGVVEHGSPFTEIDLAGPAERLGTLRAVLRAAGVTVEAAGDESALLWNKLAFLAPLALLTTSYGMTIGEVRTERRAELVAVLGEAAAVGRACGASVDVARSLALYEAFPSDARSSMQRDAEAGRPLELDAIGGALLRAARRHGVSVPVAARLVADLERRHRTVAQ